MSSICFEPKGSSLGDSCIYSYGMVHFTCISIISLKKICPASFCKTCQSLKFPLNGEILDMRYVRLEQVNKWPNSMTD